MDGIDDLLDQVMKALDFRDPALREKLRQGLEEGLDHLELDNQDLHFQFDFDGQEATVHSSGPEVTVLDGGRDDDDAPVAGDRPDFAVFDGEDIDHDPPDVAVHVMRTPLRAPSSGQGLLDVHDRQTVFRGMIPAVYRLFCDTGSFQVMLEGVGVEQVSTGQTIDVEGTHIVVRGEATGSYLRL